MGRGILLINIGTPESPTVPAVRRYLREFLSDPRVLNMPWIIRWFLVNIIIVPFRAAKSTRAYQSVWTKEGSPLMVHSQRCAEKLQLKLPQDKVAVAMRYGSPSIQAVMESMMRSGVDELIALPMFPQFSEAATASAIAEFERVIKKNKTTWQGKTKIIGDFYVDPGFINAQAQLVRERIESFKPDHLLMSYHGLPENHVQATDRSSNRDHCLIKENCCVKICDANRSCYRAQSFATSHALADTLGLPQDKWSVSFQSRLGRTPWIQPFTDVVIPELYQKGVRRLMVVCPSFVADCLETVEEIGIRARADWRTLGSEDFSLVPCVNEDDRFIDALVKLVN